MRIRKGKRRWLIISAVVIGLGLIGVVAANWLQQPSRYYAEVPNRASAAKNSVTVQGKPDIAGGAYLMLGLRIKGPLTWAQVLQAKLQPYKASLLTKKDLPFYSNTGFMDLTMQTSEDQAVQAAFHQAKRTMTVTHRGIGVFTVTKHSPFFGKIHPGDTLNAVNGKPFSTTRQYLAATRKQQSGTLTLQGNRQVQGAPFSASAKLTSGSGKRGLGITYEDFTSTITKPEVNYTDGGGGNSAGLIFALQIYTQLTGQQLRHGQKIAGTGTIDAHGRIGQIGGIAQKVYLADQAGAKVFFAPDVPATKAILKQDPHYENLSVVAQRTAKKIHSTMKVVPVKTLGDAVKYLEKH